MNHDNLSTMQIGGKLRAFQVDSMRQIEVYCAARNIELDMYATDLAIIDDVSKPIARYKAIIDFNWSALAAGAWKVNRAIDFTYDDVYEWCEELQEDNPELLVIPINFFIECRKKKNPQLVSTTKDSSETTDTTPTKKEQKMKVVKE